MSKTGIQLASTEDLILMIHDVINLNLPEDKKWLEEARTELMKRRTSK